MFSSLSLDTTQKIYDVAYYVLILSLIVSAISTALAFGAGNRISNDLKIRLAGAIKTAGEAGARAGQANERAAQLERDATEARAQIARENERAARLERDAAELRLALEAAREETQRISEGVASRQVLPAQRALIASALRGKRFDVSVVSWAGGEPEVNAYRDQLAAAFKVPGVDVTVGNSTATPAQIGLVVIDSPDSGASAVAHALGAAGIEFEYRRADVPNPILRVGIKKPTL